MTHVVFLLFTWRQFNLYWILLETCNTDRVVTECSCSCTHVSTGDNRIHNLAWSYVVLHQRCHWKLCHSCRHILIVYISEFPEATLPIQQEEIIYAKVTKTRLFSHEVSSFSQHVNSRGILLGPPASQNWIPKVTQNTVLGKPAAHKTLPICFIHENYTFSLTCSILVNILM